MLTQFDGLDETYNTTSTHWLLEATFNLHFFTFRNEAEELLSTLQRVCYNLDTARLDVARAASTGSWLQPAYKSKYVES